MLKGFHSQQTEEVCITRGDQSLTFTVQGLPAGWMAELERRFPGTHYVNGKEVPLEHGEAASYRDLLMYLRLAKGLEQDGCLESRPPPPTASAPAWRRYAEAVRDEFAAAGFVEGDLVHLLAAILRLTNGDTPIQRVKEAAGN